MQTRLPKRESNHLPLSRLRAAMSVNLAFKNKADSVKRARDADPIVGVVVLWFCMWSLSRRPLAVIVVIAVCR